MKKYVPLMGVLAYLSLTILILYTGPVSFRLHNQFLFCSFIFLYQSFFSAGYLLAIKSERPACEIINEKLSDKFYYFSFFLGVIGIIGAYNNLMLSDSFIPYGYFENLARGFSEPGLVYTERMIAADAGVTSGSRLFNILSIFFSFFKLLFIFQFVYHWKSLSIFKRMLAATYSFLFISSGIASGTNSVLFIFFIFLSFSVLVVLYVNNYKYLGRLIMLLGFLFLIPVTSFGYIMSQRGGGFDYFASTSTLGDISAPIQSIDIENASVFDFLHYSFVWLDYYLVQGYYGFSLILDMDLNWTYGFGNSAFLQRQFLLLTGIDVGPLTFQHRISSLWDESAQWHSFYGQFANDFGFAGLVVFMFCLGWLLAKTWASIIYRRSFYGAALMPIYILMFIFFPANNQVFAYIDTLSYFIFINLLWMLEGKKMRAVKNV